MRYFPLLFVIVSVYYLLMGIIGLNAYYEFSPVLIDAQTILPNLDVERWRSEIFITSLMVTGIGLFGLFVCVGLLRKRQWARKSLICTTSVFVGFQLFWIAFDCSKTYFGINILTELLFMAFVFLLSLKYYNDPRIKVMFLKNNTI